MKQVNHLDIITSGARMNRRLFLQLSGQAAAAGLVIFSPLPVTASPKPSLQAIGVVVVTYPYKPHYGLVIFPERCTGCGRCVAACGSTNAVPSYGSRVAIFSRPSAQRQSREFLPALCNQCNRPPCVRVCPTKATYKDTATGIVLMEERLCIGCGACMAACPYSARYYNRERGAVDKCDFCLASRLKKGNPLPACVEACPESALLFDDVSGQNELSRLLKSKEKTIGALRPELGTLPNVFYLI